MIHKKYKCPFFTINMSYDRYNHTSILTNGEIVPKPVDGALIQYHFVELDSIAYLRDPWTDVEIAIDPQASLENLESLLSSTIVNPYLQRILQLMVDNRKIESGRYQVLRTPLIPLDPPQKR